MTSSSPASLAWPGDDLIPDATMVFDRRREIAGGAEEIWPWLLQLGKRRAGWYLPARVERLAVPAGRRAARSIRPEYQRLAVGDHVPDYGGRHETLEVAVLDSPRTLVYRSERRGAQFSWALLLHPTDPGTTLLHLRFRGKLRSRGWRRAAIIRVGDVFDWATAELMMAGLEERVRACALGRAGVPRSSPRTRR